MTNLNISNEIEQKLNNNNKNLNEKCLEHSLPILYYKLNLDNNKFKYCYQCILNENNFQKNNSKFYSVIEFENIYNNTLKEFKNNFNDNDNNNLMFKNEIKNFEEKICNFFVENINEFFKEIFFGDYNKKINELIKNNNNNDNNSVLNKLKFLENINNENLYIVKLKCLLLKNLCVFEGKFNEKKEMLKIKFKNYSKIFLELIKIIIIFLMMKKIF